MLDNVNSQSVKINAVSGSLQKSHPKSYFKIMHCKSELWSTFANEVSAGYTYSDRPNKEYTILQVMLMQDGYIVVEVVKTEVYLLETNKND